MDIEDKYSYFEALNMNVNRFLHQLLWNYIANVWLYFMMYNYVQILSQNKKLILSQNKPTLN